MGYGADDQSGLPLGPLRGDFCPGRRSGPGHAGFGVAVLGLNVIEMMFFLTMSPLWALVLRPILPRCTGCVPTAAVPICTPPAGAAELANAGAVVSGVARIAIRSWLVAKTEGCLGARHPGTKIRQLTDVSHWDLQEHLSRKGATGAPKD
jgi:hypothetical protein